MANVEKLMPTIKWPYRELIIISRIEGVLAGMREDNVFLLDVRSISNPLELKNSYPTKKVFKESRPQQIFLIITSNNNPLFPPGAYNEYRLIDFKKSYKIKGTVYVLSVRKEDFPSKDLMVEAIKTLTAKFVKDVIYYPLDAKAKAEALERFEREHPNDYKKRLEEGELGEFITL